MVKKSKYQRRRAIDCKLVARSKANPGYCKYMITIAELDGTVHKQPAYGKDMQDALSRLMNTERTVKIERKLERISNERKFVELRERRENVNKRLEKLERGGPLEERITIIENVLRKVDFICFDKLAEMEK